MDSEGRVPIGRRASSAPSRSRADIADRTHPSADHVSQEARSSYRGLYQVPMMQTCAELLVDIEDDPAAGPSFWQSSES